MKVFCQEGGSVHDPKFGSHQMNYAPPSPPSPIPAAKRKLPGCLAHAPAREAFFLLPSGFVATALAFVSLQVSLVTWALIGQHNKPYTAISMLVIQAT